MTRSLYVLLSLAALLLGGTAWQAITDPTLPPWVNVAAALVVLTTLGFIPWISWHRARFCRKPVWWALTLCFVPLGWIVMVCWRKAGS